jgi:ABC-type Na+ efflux pump permease subunit
MQSSAENKTFKNYFSQGFKCFIVVTLLMVAFTWVFLKVTPSMKEEMAQHYRTELSKSGNKTPQEIDTLVTGAKKYFIPMLTSMAIFGYLLIGALVTLIAAGFFSQKKAA